jgi:hypothetical protein
MRQEKVTLIRELAFMFEVFLGYLILATVTFGSIALVAAFVMAIPGFLL